MCSLLYNECSIVSRLLHAAVTFGPETKRTCVRGRHFGARAARACVLSCRLIGARLHLPPSSRRPGPSRCEQDNGGGTLLGQPVQVII